jgi:hypothetical protein
VRTLDLRGMSRRHDAATAGLDASRGRELCSSSVDLLDLQFAFSQSELLDARGFARAAERRGQRLTPELLELCHRLRLLEPLFAVRRDGRAIDRAARHGDPMAHALAQDAWTSADQLRGAVALGGRVFDPASGPFVAYDRLRRSARRLGYINTAFVYSSYQLLAIPFLGTALASLTVERQDGRLRAAVHPQVVRALRAQATRTRDQVIALIALEAAYRPRATGTIRGLWRVEQHAAYEAWRAGQVPDVTCKRLGVDGAWLAAQAQHLLWFPERKDPLGPWIDVVREGDPQQWDKLRGDALTAMEHRIAAEIFLGAYEHLVRDGLATQIEERTPQGWYRLPWGARLRRRGGLDRTLMRYGISPQPDLLLVVEGETERQLFPRVLQHFGIRTDADFIALFNSKGVDAKLESLVAFAVGPRVELDDDPRYARLQRPVTQLLVAADPEGKLKTQGQRDKRRRAWCNRIVDAFEAPFRTERMRETVDNLLTLKTWDDEGSSFEFAHFDDSELVAAIRSVRIDGDRLDLAGLEADVAEARARRTGLKGVLNGASKVKLADALWPTLEAKLSGPNGDSLPIVRIVDLATELAHEHPRRGALIEL